LPRSALARLEARVGLVDHEDAAAPPHDAAEYITPGVTDGVAGDLVLVRPNDLAAVARAIDEIAATTARLLAALPSRGEPRTRDGERERARAKWRLREARIAQAVPGGRRESEK